jgi:diguanylate cyclase (GGDEF)-like protein/PAS domain S-box-containing protein
MAGVEQEHRVGRGRIARPYVRVAVTAVFTVGLVLGEFALLNGVYHRADPVRRQLVVAAGLNGRVDTATAVATQLADRDPGAVDASWSSATAVVEARVVPDVDGALRELIRAGLDPTDVRRLEASRNAVVELPGSIVRLRALAAETARLQARLAGRRQALDVQAGGIYAGLLFVVSIGWFLWFRRLVRRHRALQQAVTEREALAGSEQRLLTLVQNGSDIVAVLDADSTVSFVSPSVRAVLGVDVEEVMGTPLLDLVHPDDVGRLNQRLAGQRSGDDEAITLRMTRADGRVIVAEGMLSNLLADPTIGGFVLTVRDVTERHALQDRLTYQAFHDALTGLANRQLFGDRLSHALTRRAGSARPLVVLFCNLDAFKDVNDSIGYATGDQVLETVGKRIRSTLRAGDTAARLGGDEFAILMEDADLDGAEPFARRLIDLIAQPIPVGSGVLEVTASIGMAQAVPGESTSEEALRNADVAMYSAKDRGRSSVAIYDPGLHAEALDRLELRADLQRALRDGELVLHYQPTVELETGKITGFEALVRWPHPTRGLLSPALFIPMAEETGLIVQLGTWVLFQACRSAALLQGDWRRPSMAVNISAQQLVRPDFVDTVTRALSEAGLSADRLILEITESVVLQDLADVIPRLAALRDRGARVAIDDFGTGYSSLAYLTELPVDVLKVDKSFIDRVALDDQGASLTEAIIAMSHTMNLTTVAEGVEVAEQAAWLRRVRCPIGQGYYWSRPVDFDGVRELLARPTDERGGMTGLIGSISSDPWVSTSRPTRTGS